MLVALEVDVANLLLVTTADSSGGNAAVAVSPAGLLFGLDQTLLRLRFRNL